MVKFTVSKGGWTWDQAVEVTPPGGADPQTVTMTFRTVEDVAALLDANVRGEISNVDLIRAVATAWDVTWEDGAPMPLDSAEAETLIAQPWVSRPILATYVKSTMPAVAGNLPPSPAPGRGPGTASPPPNRQTRRASKKTGTS